VQLLFQSSSANPGNSLLDVKQLEDEIYAEIRGRIKEDDIDAPLRKAQYYYYERTLTGKEYVQHCRRLVPTDAPITVHDVMPTGPDAPDEHIILDENIKAEGHDYYSIGAFKVWFWPTYSFCQSLWFCSSCLCLSDIPYMYLT
jgi:protease II